MLEIIRSPEEAQRLITQDLIANRMGRVLQATYPNRNWLVLISEDCTVATIKCTDISLEYGYIIHLDKIAHEYELAARRAGGEILERFNLSRDKYSEDGALLRVDRRGEALGAKQGEACRT